MALIKGNCSNCGGTIEFDGSMKKGFCMQCGTPFIAENITNNNITHVQSTINVQNAVFQGANEQNLLHRAEEFKAKSDYYSAVEYANRVLDINPANNEARSIVDNTFKICGKYLTLRQVNEIDGFVNKILNTFGIGVNAIFNSMPDENYDRARILLQKYVQCSGSTATKTIKVWRERGVNAVIETDYSKAKLFANAPKKAYKDMTPKEKRNVQISAAFLSIAVFMITLVIGIAALIPPVDGEGKNNWAISVVCFILAAAAVVVSIFRIKKALKLNNSINENKSEDEKK